jgi:hypothetical protein
MLFERVGAFGQCHALGVIIHLDLLAVRRSANLPQKLKPNRSGFAVNPFYQNQAEI